MSTMRTLIEICSTTPNTLMESAVPPALAAEALSLKASFTAISTALAKMCDLTWDMEWANELMSALKLKQADHLAEPENHGQAYNPMFYLFRCADDIFQHKNDFLHVHHEVVNDRDVDATARCQAALADSLHADKLHNVRDLSRMSRMLTNFEQNWHDAVSREGGGKLSETMMENMAKLMPFLMAITSVIVSRSV